MHISSHRVNVDENYGSGDFDLLKSEPTEKINILLVEKYEQSTVEILWFDFPHILVW
jgi:hypothetical protein